MKKLIINLISLYQNSLSLVLGSHCRFYPSCSQYTKEAVEKFGIVKGCGLGLRRLSHCHPWHEGGIDPVPESGPTVTSCRVQKPGNTGNS